MSGADDVKVAAREVTMALPHLPESNLFQNRGFSDRTIRTLVGCGIDAPERLLFMTEAQLRSVPGIGPASMKAILKYQAHYLSAVNASSAGKGRLPASDRS